MSSDKDASRRERRTAIGGSLALLFGVGLSQIPWNDPGSIYAPINGAIMTGLFWLAFVGALVVVGAAAHAAWRRSSPGQRRALYHAKGWASRRDLADTYSAKALRRDGRGAQVRPSLATKASRNGYKPQPTDYGVHLGRIQTGSAQVRGRKAYTSTENSVLLYGPPGSGKTAFLINTVLDAVGACLTASTKLEVWEYTARLRARTGPVALFNPSMTGAVEGDFFWDPMSGCEHYAIAQERARALVEGTKAITEIQEGSWAEKCIDIVAKLLLAARLAGGDMSTVAFWLSNPDREDPLLILRSKDFAGWVPPGWANALQAEMHSPADRMKGSIWSLARSAVAFMNNPVVARACAGGQQADNFDVGEFLRRNGTLYLVGSDQDDTLGPLLNALTHYVYYGAKAIADRAGRLDPPLSAILDEVTSITPVPLPEWTAVARGSGIQIIAACQAPAQVRERWGQAGASALKTTIGTKLILGGIQEIDDLEEFSILAGERVVESVSEGESQSRSGSSSNRTVSFRKERVIGPAEVRKLAKQHALVLTRSANATVIKYGKGQTRAKKELKKLDKQQQPDRQRAALPQWETTATREQQA